MTIEIEFTNDLTAEEIEQKFQAEMKKKQEAFDKEMEEVKKAQEEAKKQLEKRNVVVEKIRSSVGFVADLEDEIEVEIAIQEFSSFFIKNANKLTKSQKNRLFKKLDQNPVFVSKDSAPAKTEKSYFLFDLEEVKKDCPKIFEYLGTLKHKFKLMNDQKHFAILDGKYGKKGDDTANLDDYISFEAFIIDKSLKKATFKITDKVVVEDSIDLFI